MWTLQLFLFHLSRCLANIWIEGKLPSVRSSAAIGIYNRNIYIIGGGYDSGTGLTEYSIDTETFQDLVNWATLPSGNNQFWTQQQDIVYMLTGTQGLETFNLRTQSYSYY
eukprot:191901_1